MTPYDDLPPAHKQRLTILRDNPEGITQFEAWLQYDMRASNLPTYVSQLVQKFGYEIEKKTVTHKVAGKVYANTRYKLI